MRKRLLQYDDVLNKQREIVYGLRNETLQTDDPRKLVFDFICDELDERVAAIAPNGSAPEPADLQVFCSWITSRFPIAIIPEQLEGKSPEEITNIVVEEIRALYKIREEIEDPEALKAIERFVLMRALDKNWQDHLTEMEDLRRSIGLRGYGQKDPLNEYKGEAYKCFESLMGRIRNDVCMGIFRSASSLDALQAMIARVQQKVARAGDAAQARAEEHQAQAQAAAIPEPEQPKEEPKKEIELPKIEARIELPKIGRNDNVVIEKNGEVKTMKFKKAESLILDGGWRLVKWERQ